MKQSFSGFYSPTDEEISNAWRDKKLSLFLIQMFFLIYIHIKKVHEMISFLL